MGEKKTAGSKHVSEGVVPSAHHVQSQKRSSYHASVLSFERGYFRTACCPGVRIYIKGPNSVVKMLELALNKQMLGLVRLVVG